MDILRKILVVQLSRVATTVNDDATELVHSWQPLQFRLSITFSNENGEHSRDGGALMARMGESDFASLWRKLFHTVRIVPVVVQSQSSELSNEDKGASIQWPQEQEREEKEEKGEEKKIKEHEKEESRGDKFFSFGTPPFWSTTSSPMERNSAFSSSSTSSGLTVVAGKILTVVEGPDSNIAIQESLSSISSEHSTDLKKTIPSCITSVYNFNHTLPDLENYNETVTIGYVLLLPLLSEKESPNEKEKEKKNKKDNIILRALIASEEQSMIWYRPSSIVLGTCYYRMPVGKVLQCTSTARHTAHLSVLVNVNVMNIISVPICIQKASFDIFSTWIGDTLGSLSSVPLCSEQRAAPRGADLKALELLRQAVMVTPIVVDDFSIPVLLEPGESVGFQFSIRVQPHMCYLLESHSLLELYGKFVKSPPKEVAEFDTKTSSSKPSVTNVSSPSQSIAATAIVSPPERVSRDELLQVLSWSFTSHVYVYYNIMSSRKDACYSISKQGDGVDTQSGLHLRHPVRWSMLLP
ncbi:Protein X92 [Trypanosoma theileri]|uniref:Protein X92 n=1 Tax=Trypanosoma theileri TaxID=67003 RepID=A0A1X0NYF3_9TRYP|nr:Protein X92 [Trypanosoma theileri]ORC89249.1 Protein X92 [Trypanosoma theileri]